MREKLIEFIENGFLKDLLTQEGVTDISYNGEDIFYKDNLKGRIKSEIKVTQAEVNQFLRQIANETDSQFSVTEPILDVSVGKYRINATHISVSRKSKEKVFNFSIRIAYENLRIKDNDSFISKKALYLLQLGLKNGCSIAISGKTGTGKTEFQKYLISKFEPNTRVIIVDSVDEFDTSNFAKHLDTQTWIIPAKYRNINAEDLIRNALRSNPDRIVVGESRGKEMLTVLNSSMSGHPTITTLHALDASSTYSRMARMCMIGNESLSYDDVLLDIYEHFNFIVHIKSYFDNKRMMFVRYVDSIGTSEREEYYELYKYPNVYKELPLSLVKRLNLSEKECQKINKKLVGNRL